METFVKACGDSRGVVCGSTHTNTPAGRERHPGQSNITKTDKHKRAEFYVAPGWEEKPFYTPAATNSEQKRLLSSPISLEHPGKQACKAVCKDYDGCKEMCVCVHVCACTHVCVCTYMTVWL